MVTEAQKQLALAIMDFLSKSSEDGTLVAEQAEGLDVAIQCIGEAFGVDGDNEEQRAQLSIAPATLPGIFEVFRKTQARKRGGDSSTPDAAPVVGEKEKREAEEAKALGNAQMAAKSYAQAISHYDRAISLNPTSAVYYANRAAAYSQMGNHQQAVEDALKASEVDPNYSKVYSRLG